MRVRSLLILAVAVAAPPALVASCDSDAEVMATAATGPGGAGASGPSSGGSGGNAGASSGGSGGYLPQEATCQGQIYACGDTVDNDMDGEIDMADPDCTGPCDNTEDSYLIGIPGSEGPGCIVDCYWDNDSGSGNDECCWSHECDPNEVAPDYYPEPDNGVACEYDMNANPSCSSDGCAELFMTQHQDCYDICGPLTPNGCDCFGCCEFPPNSDNFVWLGSRGASGEGTCTQAELMDPTECHPCLPVDACMNDCGPCEYCFGKTELPPECFDPDGGDGPQECPEDFPIECDPQNPVCPMTDYCQSTGCFCLQGCCVPNPV
jgi:hypothetical protein